MVTSKGGGLYLTSCWIGAISQQTQHIQESHQNWVMFCYRSSQVQQVQCRVSNSSPAHNDANDHSWLLGSHTSPFPGRQLVRTAGEIMCPNEITWLVTCGICSLVSPARRENRCLDWVMTPLLILIGFVLFVLEWGGVFFWGGCFWKFTSLTQVKADVTRDWLNKTF